MELHGTVYLKQLWNIVEHCGTLWNIVEHCGTLWNIVEHCGTLWICGPGKTPKERVRCVFNGLFRRFTLQYVLLAMMHRPTDPRRGNCATTERSLVTPVYLGYLHLVVVWAEEKRADNVPLLVLTS